jgi:hypothetical protein
MGQKQYQRGYGKFIPSDRGNGFDRNWHLLADINPFIQQPTLTIYGQPSDLEMAGGAGRHLAASTVVRCGSRSAAFFR